MTVTRHNKSGKSGKIGSLVLLLIAAGLAFLVWREISSPPPDILLSTEVRGIGRSTAIPVEASDARGLLEMTVELQQGGQRIPVLAETYGSPWTFWRPGPRELSRDVRVGRAHQERLLDGEAELRIKVRNKNWLSSRTILTRLLTVRSVPPTVTVNSGLLYINQAGSEMALYTVSRHTMESGVEAGSYFFPGYPLPGGAAGERLALFAFPYDLPPDTPAQVMARDDAGNETRVSLPIRLLSKNFRKREIPITDSFIQATVPAILSRTPELDDQDDPLKNFLLVNGELRRRNREKIAEMAQQTSREFLWQGAFQQLSNSAVESQFADYRSYLYDGKMVDQQVHLGYDLAAVRHAPVLAANSGNVVFADYLGIFGNTILIDHGFGLQSLYAHLNSFAAKPGDKVEKGQQIAESGSTGLAGGDHLHFTTLLHGVEVNPLEWWDPLWVERHILARLPSGRQDGVPLQ